MFDFVAKNGDERAVDVNLQRRQVVIGGIQDESDLVNFLDGVLVVEEFSDQFSDFHVLLGITVDVIWRVDDGQRVRNAESVGVVDIVDVDLVVIGFVWDQLEAERILPVHIEDEISHPVDERRLSGIQRANQQDRAMLLGANLVPRIGDCRLPKHKLITRFESPVQFGQRDGQKVHSIQVDANLLALIHQLVGKTIRLTSRKFHWAEIQVFSFHVVNFQDVSCVGLEILQTTRCCAVAELLKRIGGRDLSFLATIDTNPKVGILFWRHRPFEFGPIGSHRRHVQSSWRKD